MGGESVFKRTHAIHAQFPLTELLYCRPQSTQLRGGGSRGDQSEAAVICGVRTFFTGIKAP